MHDMPLLCMQSVAAAIRDIRAHGNGASSDILHARRPAPDGRKAPNATRAVPPGSQPHRDVIKTSKAADQWPHAAKKGQPHMPALTLRPSRARACRRLCRAQLGKAPAPPPPTYKPAARSLLIRQARPWRHAAHGGPAAAPPPGAGPAARPRSPAPDPAPGPRAWPAPARCRPRCPPRPPRRSCSAPGCPGCRTRRASPGPAGASILHRFLR